MDPRYDCILYCYYDFTLYNGIISYKLPECENCGCVGEYSHFLLLRRSMLKYLSQTIWEIPWTEEAGYSPWGHRRVGHE